MSHSSPLIEQLTAAVAPHLGSTDAASPKAVAKTLKKLAKHLTKQQRAAHKAAHSPKHHRKVLVGELMTSLQGFLTPAGDGVAELPKAVAKTVKRLAAQLDNDRRKQAKRAAKSTRSADLPAPKLPAAPVAAKRPPTRKAVPAKLASAKPIPAKAAPARAE